MLRYDIRQSEPGISHTQKCFTLLKVRKIYAESQH